MTQYKKLFDNSEIEYITPFLKLWMSFNSWYKQNFPDLRTDRDAINNYKNYGEIKTEFLRLFDHSSDSGILFNNALYGLVLNLKNYDLKNTRDERVDYAEGLIGTNGDRRGGKDPIYISTEKKVFQIDSQTKEIFFENTLEIIYQIRCNLVHGSFDIENQYFLGLVENSYKILYPIMDRILQNI